MCALSVHHRHNIIQMLQRPLTNAKYSWEMLKSCSLCWSVFSLLMNFVGCLMLLNFTFADSAAQFWKSVSLSLFKQEVFLAFSIANENRLSRDSSYDCCIFIHRNSLSKAVAGGVLPSILRIFCHSLPSNNVFQFQMEWRNGFSITNMLVLKIFLHLTNDGNCMLNDDQQRKHDKRNKTIKIISLK